MRRRELGARVQTSSPALDRSAPPAIASSRTEGSSREDQDSGGARSRRQGGMGQCASRQGSVAAAGGGGAGEGRRGCLAVAREQRSRFYIFRRCVAMLVCWHKYKKI
ncbi:hypothetical protein GQ55_9G412900 [Panicum hallii var. hallii]|uniref:ROTUNDIFOLIA like 8 n=2 Tax=Panicum hallii TaxID=206008 RepID=A0A2T7CAF8_9POAL|nr:uncharacterized protein LOC112876750 [Panicum hallii]PAN48680.1 hypothetical protein PAHAL_9G398500 [Panicum hallii]PUZ40315.1 hypothetical protein GQ55_9G412900 [Panicum hallii var. hallii]